MKSERRMFGAQPLVCFLAYTSSAGIPGSFRPIMQQQQQQQGACGKICDNGNVSSQRGPAQALGYFKSAGLLGLIPPTVPLSDPYQTSG